MFRKPLLVFKHSISIWYFQEVEHTSFQAIMFTSFEVDHFNHRSSKNNNFDILLDKEQSLRSHSAQNSANCGVPFFAVFLCQEADQSPVFINQERRRKRPTPSHGELEAADVIGARLGPTGPSRQLRFIFREKKQASFSVLCVWPLIYACK